MTTAPLAPGDLLHCPHRHLWHALTLNNSTSDAVLGMREGPLLRWTDRRVESVRHSFSHPPIVGYDHVMPNTDRDPKPAIAWDELLASTERPIHPNIHESIIQAIEGRNFVTLVLHGHEIAGEPHLYGVRGGHPMLLLFNAESDEQWQMVDVTDVTQSKSGSMNTSASASYHPNTTPTLKMPEKRTGLVCPSCRQSSGVIENTLPNVIVSCVRHAVTAGQRKKRQGRSISRQAIEGSGFLDKRETLDYAPPEKAAKRLGDEVGERGERHTARRRSSDSAGDR